MKYLKLLLCIALCEAVGLIGSIFTVNSINNWYSLLVKPSFAPPNWVFGPVWISLYVLMGAAFFLVWVSGGKHKELAYGVFGLQLFLNGLWCVLFFGYHSLGYSFLDIIFLWLAIVLTIGCFVRFSRVSVGLLLPYLVWVSIALELNYSIYMLNNIVII